MQPDRPSTNDLSPAKRALLERLRRGGSAGASAAAPAIPRRPDPQIAPASLVQERIWFIEQLIPGTSAYHVPFAVDVEGDIDPDRLRACLDVLVARHETLRTCLELRDGSLVQLIRPTVPTPLAVEDLPADVSEQELDRRVADELGRPFDIARGVLFRVHLFRIAPGRQVLLLNIHHLIGDGWSKGVLLTELARLYDAEGAPAAARLPALPVSYGDFAAWERGQPDPGLPAYWRERFASAPDPLELPTDRPRPPAQTMRGARHWFELPPALVAQLGELGRRHNLTLFMVLLTGLKALLARYSGQEDVAVGTPTAGRSRPELERLVGCFVNTLVLRTACRDEQTFAELLAAVGETATGAFGEGELPFERLVEHVQVERDLSRTALFQVLFVLENTPMPAMRLGGARLVVREAAHTAAQYDLLLYFIADERGALRGFFEYATDLFDAATVARMAGHLTALLDHAARAPDTRLADLEILGADERAELDRISTGPRRDYGGDGRLSTLLAEQAARTPDRPALVFRDEALTYGELWARVNRLAHHLRREGVVPDDLVGVAAERSIEMVVAILAITAAGGAYLPLDPSYPPARLRQIVEDAAPRLVLGQADAAREVVEAGGGRWLPVEEAEAAARGLPEEHPAPVGDGDSAAYVIYTSGSTGKPKGVVVPHRGICNRLAWMQEAYQLGADDRVAQKTPFGFDVSVWEFFWPLVTGACLVVAEPGGHRDPGYLVDLIERERITTIHFVPSMLRAFLAAPDLGRCAALRRVVCSGEALTPDLVRDFHRSIGCELHNLYGPTEASVDVSAWQCPPEAGSLRAIPIGRPIANTELHVLDRQRRAVPIGVAGELHIGGVQLARGYLNRPELTAERFIECAPDGSRRARLYATGDRARFLAGGDIEYLGRLDRQVKVRGHRIELGEIEAVMSSDPRVGATVVVPRTAPSGSVQLVAYVTPRPGIDLPSPAELRALCGESLPDAMVPSAFVRLESLPLGPTGKVDLKALPAPERDDLAADAPRQAPRNPLEETLAGIWREVLGQELGVHDNFFALGGDSILSLRVVMRAKEASIALEPRHMFAAQTVAELAALVAGDESAPPAPAAADAPSARCELGPAATRALRRADVEAVYPLLPVQQHMLRMFRAGSEPGIYRIQRVFVLEGTLDPADLAAAWRDTVRRHPVLRAAIAEAEGEPPRLVVHADNDSRLAFQDVRALAPSEREDRVREHFHAAREGRLDVAHPEPISIRVYRFGDAEYRFALMFNYMFLDGWSLGILFRDLVTAYLARRQGVEPGLPPVPPLDAYFAAARAAAPPDAAGFWRGWLGGVRPTPIVEHAPGAPAPGGGVYTRQHRVLSAALTARLEQTARRHHVTLNTLVQGLWGLLLGRHAAAPDAVFGVTTTGRPPTMEGVELAVGPFINTLPVRVPTPADAPVDAWLREVQETQQRARLFERTPQAEVREALGVPAGQRLFDHYMVFQNLGELMAVGGTAEVRIAPMLPSFYTKTEVPLRIDVFPGAELALFMSYYERSLGANAVARLLDDWVELLERVTDERVTTLAQLAPAGRHAGGRLAARPTGLLARISPVRRPRARLVCFPHGGANTSAYRPWRPLLPPDVELCAVRLPGRDGRIDEPLLTHVLGMAGEVAEAIAHEEDDTPLVFFGHSMGAVIALETIRSLRWRGHPGPRALIVSGRGAPQFPRRQPDIRDLPHEAFVEHIRGYGGTPPEILADAEVMSVFVPVLRGDFRAVETYLNQPDTPLPIPLVVLGGDADEVSREELEGWQSSSALPCRCLVLAGDHFFLVPHRQRVVAEVLRALDRVAPPAPARGPAATAPEVSG